MISHVSVLIVAAALPALAASEASVRESAAKSVALLQKAAGQWRMPCVSCHHQSMPMLALEAARAHGLAVDEPAARAAAERAFKHFTDIDLAVQAHGLIDPAVGDGYTLVGAHAAGVQPGLTTGVYARLIARHQHDGGNWDTFDARPPHSAGLFVATAIAARAVALYLPDSLQPERRERLERARRWLAAAKAEATEDLTYRLLGLLWTGAAEAERGGAARELLAAQRSDGGWAQLPAMTESDAYSTAQALYALRQAGGVARDVAPFQRGVEWLLRTQAADGSWLVKSRLKTPVPVSPPYFESGFPYGHDQFLSCAATAWAVMALSEALPAAATPAKPLALNGVAPVSEPWMQKALFGTPEQVAQLDPALATPGGTTVLMMASDHPAKVQALLKNGAKAAATAQSGYDALMTASLYPGNRESLALLLGAGLSAKPRAKVRFKAAPVNIATFTGDAGLVVHPGRQPQP
jgi:hypothetical protein